MLMRVGEFDSMLARMEAFRRSMDRLFDEFEHGPSLGALGGWPRTQLYNDGKNISVQAEVPGLSAGDIDVQVQANQITISGERKNDAPEGYSVHRRERPPMRFSRSFTLPAEVDPEKTKARVADGILTLELTKSEKAMPRQITVKAS